MVREKAPFPVPCFRCLSGAPRPPGESKEAQLKSNTSNTLIQCRWAACNQGVGRGFPAHIVYPTEEPARKM